jgi:UDP-N-acetylglucosamine 1-carboxyvinyltransferase
MKDTDNIARIVGGRPLTGTVDISGSKHSALHILGAALLAAGDVFIDHFPRIDDTLNLLRIYQSVGVPCRLEGTTAVLTVLPENIRWDESRLDLAARLRSSVLLMGSFLLRSRRLKMPFPGGDRIDADGRRSIDEFLRILEMFGIRYRLHDRELEVWMEGKLEGDRILDLGRPDLFSFPTGNSRTALAMILAAGNRGRTTIHSALKAAEIQQLGDFLQSLGYGVTGLGSHILEIEGEGSRACGQVGSSRVLLYPDKCEIAFWMVAACLTRGNLVLRLPGGLGGYSLDHLGPLYRIREAILAPMNIPIEQISDCEFRIAAEHARCHGMDLILDHLESEFDGRVMDASPYFIPLMCVADGESRYLDGKYGRTRVAFTRELNRLGADIDVRPGGLARIRGGRKLTGSHVWCSAYEIRGAGALLLSMLAIEGENYLSGMEYLRRANEYLPKLIQLGCDIESIDAAEKDDLLESREFRVRAMRRLQEGTVVVDYEGRPAQVFMGTASLPELIHSIFLHPTLLGATGIEALVGESCDERFLAIEIPSSSEDKIEVCLHRQGGAVSRLDLGRKPIPAVTPSGLEEYIGIEAGSKRYFAGRCLNPVRYEEWKNRILEIAASPAATWIPLTVTMGITEECNFDCPFCFARENLRRECLSREALLRTIDQIADAGVRAVRFVGAGETTLHSHFIEALLLAKTRGLRTFLITNGSRLGLHPRIYASCLDSIRISVHCADAGPVESRTGSSAPANRLVLDGIERVKKHMGADSLLGASYVVTVDGIDGMVRSAEGLKQAGADYLLFKKDHRADFTEDQRSAIESNLKQIIQTYEDPNFRIVPELFDYKAAGLVEDYDPNCLLLQLRAVIQANGDVLTCNQKGSACFARLGNIYQNSFLEIIHGDERRKAIERRRSLGAVCPDCLFKDAHLLIQATLKAREHPEFRIGSID